MYSVIYVLRDDADQLVASYKSLLACTPSNLHFKVIVVDGGANSPEDIQKVQHEVCTEVIRQPDGTPYYDLSSALNEGIYRSIGYTHENIKNLVIDGGAALDHVVWCHSDMMFYQFDWITKLCQIYDHLWPLVGRLGPSTSNIDGGLQLLNEEQYLVHSNNCPWVMGSEYIKMMIQKRGFVYDPDFIRIGGVEDHCAWFDILEMGMFVCVTPLVDVVHLGAGVRFLRDTNADQMHNREVMLKKYGRDIFPKIDFDLAQVQKDVGSTFGHLKTELLNLIPERNKTHNVLKELFNIKRAKLGLELYPISIETRKGREVYDIKDAAKVLPEDI